MSIEFRQTALPTAKEYLIKGNEKILPQIKKAKDLRSCNRDKESIERVLFFKRFGMRKTLAELLYLPKEIIKEKTRDSLSWPRKYLEFSAAYICDKFIQNPYYNNVNNAINFFEEHFPKLKVKTFLDKIKKIANNWKKIRNSPPVKLIQIYGNILNFVEKVWFTTLNEKYHLLDYCM